jgi:ADP-ribosylglycohydrolase
MLGAIAGDVIGSVHEGAASRGREFTLFGEKSCFTDDTVCAIAIAHALRRGKRFDEALRLWCRRYPNAGYRAGFHAWFSVDDAEPYYSRGNGSAMRVAPIAWACDDLAEVVELAEHSAAVSHNHPDGIRGACATAAAVFAARTGQTKDQIAALMVDRFGFDCGADLATMNERGGFDATCPGTIPNAVGAFLHSKDFEDAMRIAVSLGGDTDTTACIAGGIAEAFYGGVPADIRQETLRRLDDPIREELFEFFRHVGLGTEKERAPKVGIAVSASDCCGVLVECYSLIVRMDAIYRKLAGGWPVFRSTVTNQTLCTDMDIVRVGFMGQDDAEDFAHRLERMGLRYLVDGKSEDMALVLHQPMTFLTPCDWLTLNRVNLSATGSTVAACCLKGREISRVALPEGWRYEGSLSHTFYVQMPEKGDGTKPSWIKWQGGPS